MGLYFQEKVFAPRADCYVYARSRIGLVTQYFLYNLFDACEFPVDPRLKAHDSCPSATIKKATDAAYVYAANDSRFLLRWCPVPCCWCVHPLPTILYCTTLQIEHLRFCRPSRGGGGLSVRLRLIRHRVKMVLGIMRRHGRLVFYLFLDFVLLQNGSRLRTNSKLCCANGCTAVTALF